MNRLLKLANLVDLDNPTCEEASITVPGVEPCIDEPCILTPGTITSGTCNQNDTPTDGSDDFYVVSYTAPDVINGANQYDVLNFQLAYLYFYR